MIIAELLFRLFIKNHENTKDLKTRTAYGVLAGAVGVVVNLILTAAKLFIGSLTGSISITADAVNNLADAGSSVVTLAGFQVAKRPADKEHPYGHGRVEYISALVVAFLVLLMGFELLKSSVGKIYRPEPVTFSVTALVILVLSMLFKLWLAYFNGAVGKRIHSGAAKAVVADSLSDTAATGAALLALILSKSTSAPVDGWFGLVVAGFILYSGAGILKDTISPLLGQPPEKELVDAIEAKILSYDGVVGVHDLIVHDYGPGRLFASAHAEVPANVSVMKSHDTIDLIEQDILKELNILISIHLDPVVTDDARVNEMKAVAEGAVRKIDPRLTLHDFRVVDGPTHSNLIFDVVVPLGGISLKDHEVKALICEKLSEIDGRYFCVITVDHAFH